MKIRWFMSMVVVFSTWQTTAAAPGETFSSLSIGDQSALRNMVEPPPTAERRGPYSTPMYYLMHKGFKYDGALDQVAEKRFYIKDKPGPDHGSWTLDRNRPDWQEAMISDWAELGLNSTHLNIHPVDDQLTLSPEIRAALNDYVRLSHRYGLKIGVRLDALDGYRAWPMHPNNPENRMEEYLAYTREVARIFQGKTQYYILGDELKLHQPSPDLDRMKWTPQQYLGYFKRLSSAIKSQDPNACVSMFGATSGDWDHVLMLLKAGYADYGDAVAINHYNYKSVIKYYQQARELAPDLRFLSNGVGYISTKTAEPRFPEGDPYGRRPTEVSHGQMIAKHMFAWWELGADVAPYYITLRNWVFDGKVYPRWFGFFGIQDFVVDAHGNMTVKRYPGWYAFQTIAHIFYNKDELKKPAFEIKSDPPLSNVYTYIRDHEGGSEMIVTFWNDPGATDAKIKFATNEFRYPVIVNLFNKDDWQDAVHDAGQGVIEVKVRAEQTPTVLRLFKKK